jgi:threonine aldolase
MVFFRITDPEVKTAALSAFLFEKNIRSYMIENTILRFVVHFYIREAQI